MIQPSVFNSFQSHMRFSQGPLSTLELSKDPKILIDPEKPPHTSFFHFRTNSLF